MDSPNPLGTDETLLRMVSSLKADHQDKESSEYLAGRYRPRLFNYFRSHKFSKEDAEDLVQETFRRVFMSIGTLRDATRFESWLFQVARNLRLSARSSTSQLQGESQDLNTVWNSPGTPIVQDPLAASIHSERLRRTLGAVENLSPQQRQCVILRVVHEMRYVEIATVLQLSVRTVRNHLREARLNLKRRLRED